MSLGIFEMRDSGKIYKKRDKRWPLTPENIIWYYKSTFAYGKLVKLTRDTDRSWLQHRWDPYQLQILQKSQFDQVLMLASIHHECTWILEFLWYSQQDSKCPKVCFFPYQNIGHSSHTWGRFVHWVSHFSTEIYF